MSANQQNTRSQKLEIYIATFEKWLDYVVVRAFDVGDGFKFRLVPTLLMGVHGQNPPNASLADVKKI